MARLYVAVDTGDLEQAQRIARLCGPHAAGLKVGHAFALRYGAAGVAGLLDLAGPECRVMLDLKLHDIPVVVAEAVRSALLYPKVSLITIHTLGGAEMVRAASEAASGSGVKVIAVTVMTSIDALALTMTGQDSNLHRQALLLARLSRVCGADGVVCAASEAEAVRREAGRDTFLVVPGIRRADWRNYDQRRVATPGEAVRAGADVVVVGRGVTWAPEPDRAAADVAGEIASETRAIEERALAKAAAGGSR